MMSSLSQSKRTIWDNRYAYVPGLSLHIKNMPSNKKKKNMPSLYLPRNFPKWKKKCKRRKLSEMSKREKFNFSTQTAEEDFYAFEASLVYMFQARPGLYGERGRESIDTNKHTATTCRLIKHAWFWPCWTHKVTSVQRLRTKPALSQRF